MHSGRKHHNSKKTFPFAIAGIFLISVLTVTVNQFAHQQIDLLSSYLISVNMVTFMAFGLDKILAAQHAQRIPEKILFASSLIGGIPAALLAMHIFRHKTQKGSFQVTLGAILVIQVLLLIIMYNLK